ncbi:UDP-N-acetylmuramoyl-L-alanine--D-glutamate ligase [Helicobacter sp. 11S02596-1]|uniref:UDP-N-acetylmuramoyl-L-alanine--D-glutamate ligase n=1 Tax=Helicobacter sp. 11S02596-1 TaxID=1476194 RepID=UPI000BA782CD|nr:UDP-N-acetylmuramoyl-L-alanine--D-glutamate ligase [Helicobacter sp. 11S02596-1]PAF44842.1 UDP-N-acetylmuramoyl-L-alanine--D-glutamate ligase [Helicobacter sp. 11S02596-1]
MQRISIFGYGITTKPIVNFLNNQGILCNIFDDKFSRNSTDERGNFLLPSGAFKPQDSAYQSTMEILSPGIPPSHPLIQNAKNLISEYDYFYGLFSAGYSPKSIWISGTNGKTTTTEMLTLLLGKFGAKSGGNIGTPLAELYTQKSHLWVLETSSFSLHYTHKAFPNLYLLLPVKQDHIDWHGSFEAYICDKLKPLLLMPKDTFAILPYEFHTRPEVKEFLGKAFFYKDSFDLAQQIGVPLEAVGFGEPFLLDALLALQACKLLFGIIDVDLLGTFQVGAHRIEEFHDKAGRLWVDDSKGTNVDATLEALKRYQNKKIFLILGGDDKGADQQPIFELAKNLDIEIFAIGSNEKKLLGLAKDFGIAIHSCGELEKAVKKIKDSLGLDGVGLLSPAAASLDQFVSYKERGELFQQYALNE